MGKCRIFSQISDRWERLSEKNANFHWRICIKNGVLVKENITFPADYIDNHMPRPNEELHGAGRASLNVTDAG